MVRIRQEAQENAPNVSESLLSDDIWSIFLIACQRQASRMGDSQSDKLPAAGFKDVRKLIRQEASICAQANFQKKTSHFTDGT
ncbi:MAG: hypothetical protein IJ845_06310 [Bacteroidaceae bacterium]|nr:hypothetical protein [Bacteroidaceae bacterium]